MDAHQPSLMHPQPPETATTGIPFITDPELVRRLEQLENGLADTEYRAGVLCRECRQLRLLLAPRDSSAPQGTPEPDAA